MPIRKIAAISRDVAIGFLMKGVEMLIGQTLPVSAARRGGSIFLCPRKKKQKDFLPWRGAGMRGDERWAAVSSR
jgi:hypothetical protein